MKWSLLVNRLEMTVKIKSWWSSLQTHLKISETQFVIKVVFWVKTSYKWWFTSLTKLANISPDFPFRQSLRSPVQLRQQEHGLVWTCPSSSGTCCLKGKKKTLQFSYRRFKMQSKPRTRKYWPLLRGGHYLKSFMLKNQTRTPKWLLL